jgi:glutathione S-transferase
VYTLHIANKNYSSWSLRPWLVLKTLDIPFTEIIHPFGLPDGSGYESFSPSGRVPCLEADGMLIWDSLAIIEYLAERHTGVWPLPTVARAWARSASAEMHSSFMTLRNTCGMSCGVRVALRERTPALERDIERIGALWSDGINRFGGPFLAGSTFSAVDAFFAPVTFRALTYGLDFGHVGNNYAEMLRKQPAMREWYEAGLAETWREQGHEDEILASGDITEDYRAVG